MQFIIKNEIKINDFELLQKDIAWYFEHCYNNSENRKFK